MKVAIPVRQACGMKGRLAAACRKGLTDLYMGQIFPSMELGLAPEAVSCLSVAWCFAASNFANAASISSNVGVGTGTLLARQ